MPPVLYILDKRVKGDVSVARRRSTMFPKVLVYFMFVLQEGGEGGEIENDLFTFKYAH